MGILVLGEELLAPSHEWMRHMLEALAEDVAVLCSPDPSCHKYRDRFRTVALDSDRTLWTRINRRFGRAPIQRKLAEAAADPEVDLVLVHYVRQRIAYAVCGIGRGLRLLPRLRCYLGRRETGIPPVHRRTIGNRRALPPVQFIAIRPHGQRLLSRRSRERIHVNYLA